MSWLRGQLHAWRQDRILGGLLRNTGYLFSANTFSLVLSMVQSILAARLLGVEQFGMVGAVTVFTSTINRLFSFRMGELTVKYFGQYQVEGSKERAAAVVKAAGLIEALTSLLAFALLLLLSPLAARVFAKDPSTLPLFMLYGLTIPGNLMTETATGVLQVTRRYRSQALVNVGQALLTALLIAVAFFTGGGMAEVVIAYLLGKVILGVGPMLLAVRALREILGRGWWQAPFSLLPPLRELAHFALTTNLSATLNLVVRDSELLWVAYFLTPQAAGYYKVALAIIGLVMSPITPFIATSYPEINRAVAEKAWPALKRLLRRITIISGAWTGAVSVGLLLFGNWLILFYGAEFLPAYPALLVLLLGFGTANVLFWNRSLHLAHGRPGFPFQVMFWTGLVKVLLSVALVPRYGYVMQAALLSAYFVVSVGLITWFGLRRVRQAEAAVAD